MWGIRVEVQVYKRELHTHIHIDYIRVEFLSCINIYIYIYISFVSQKLMQCTLSSGVKARICVKTQELFRPPN